MSRRKAVVLLSGGLDSATTLALALHRGFSCSALTCAYGQRHGVEIKAAQAVARALGVLDHRILKLDLAGFGGSALTDASLEVPRQRGDDEIGQGIPATYVPARNTVLLSLALAWAEALGSFDIFIGVNALDYSGYPDCRPEFIRSFEETANLATAAGVEAKGRFRIHTPIIRMTKAEIIQQGVGLGLDYGLTHSCYDPDEQGTSCGRCDACLLRRRGFAEIGMVDPLPYQVP